jgi:hypothetical protein
MARRSEASDPGEAIVSGSTGALAMRDYLVIYEPAEAGSGAHTAPTWMASLRWG